VLKVLNIGRVDGRMEPVIIEDIPVYVSGTAVIGLRIYSRYHGDRRLLVMSRDQLQSLPLHRCGRRNTCTYVTCLLNYLLLKAIKSCPFQFSYTYTGW